MAVEKKFLIPCMSSLQPIIFLIDLDKNHKKHTGLFKKHFRKKKFEISSVQQHQLPISTFPIMCKPLGTVSCHSNKDNEQRQ